MFHNLICVEDKGKEIPGNFQPYWHVGCSVCPVSTRNASIHWLWSFCSSPVIPAFPQCFWNPQESEDHWSRASALLAASMLEKLFDTGCRGTGGSSEETAAAFGMLRLYKLLTHPPALDGVYKICVCFQLQSRI